MRRVIGWVLVAGIVVAFAWWLIGLPGLVSAQIGETVISAPIPVFILAAGVLFLAIYVVVRLFALLLGSPDAFGRRRSRLRRQDGDSAVTRTLIALAAGDGTAAERGAARSRKLLGDTPQTLLLAAYAGRLAGKEDEATGVFQALAARSDAAFLGHRGLLQQAIARKDWTAAAQIAREAEKANPGAPWLREERAQLAIHEGSWKEAMALSGPTGPTAALATAAALQEPLGTEGRKLAKRAWEADPALAPAAVAYARQLRAAGKEWRAQEVLRGAWAKAPHPDITTLMLAEGTDKWQRMRLAESLAGSAPESAESSFMLAQVASEGGMTTEAQAYAQSAQQRGMNQRRLWLLMADVAGKIPDPDAQSEALRQAASAEPDPAWRCAQCGTAHEAWHPVCDACQTPGQIGWTASTQTASATRVVRVTTSDGVIS